MKYIIKVLADGTIQIPQELKNVMPEIDIRIEGNQIIVDGTAFPLKGYIDGTGIVAAGECQREGDEKYKSYENDYQAVYDFGRPINDADITYLIFKNKSKSVLANINVDQDIDVGEMKFFSRTKDGLDNKIQLWSKYRAISVEPDGRREVRTSSNFRSGDYELINGAYTWRHNSAESIITDDFKNFGSFVFDNAMIGNKGDIKDSNDILFYMGADVDDETGEVDVSITFPTTFVDKDGRTIQDFIFSTYLDFYGVVINLILQKIPKLRSVRFWAMKDTTTSYTIIGVENNGFVVKNYDGSMIIAPYMQKVIAIATIALGGDFIYDEDWVGSYYLTSDNRLVSEMESDSDIEVFVIEDRVYPKFLKSITLSQKLSNAYVSLSSSYKGENLLIGNIIFQRSLVRFIYENLDDAPNAYFSSYCYFETGVGYINLDEFVSEGLRVAESGKGVSIRVYTADLKGVQEGIDVYFEKYISGGSEISWASLVNGTQRVATDFAAKACMFDDIYFSDKFLHIGNNILASGCNSLFRTDAFWFYRDSGELKLMNRTTIREASRYSAIYPLTKVLNANYETDIKIDEIYGLFPNLSEVSSNINIVFSNIEEAVSIVDAFVSSGVTIHSVKVGDLVFDVDSSGKFIDNVAKDLARIMLSRYKSDPVGLKKEIDSGNVESTDSTDLFTAYIEGNYNAFVFPKDEFDYPKLRLDGATLIDKLSPNFIYEISDTGVNGSIYKKIANIKLAIYDGIVALNDKYIQEQQAFTYTNRAGNVLCWFSNVAVFREVYELEATADGATLNVHEPEVPVCGQSDCSQGYTANPADRFYVEVNFDTFDVSVVKKNDCFRMTAIWNVESKKDVTYASNFYTLDSNGNPQLSDRVAYNNNYYFLSSVTQDNGFVFEGHEYDSPFVVYNATKLADGSIEVTYSAYDKNGNDVTDLLNTITVGDKMLHKEM